MRFVSFISVLNEAAAHATTGHLEHVGDFLYHGDPHSAVEHIEKIHQRFQGIHDAEHKLSLKVDGGMSIVLGRDHKGRHFVGYKTSVDKMKFHSPKQIMDYAKKEKKPYYADLVHVLKRTKGMKKLQHGTAFQADLVHNSESEEKEVAQPNAIKYRPPKGKKLMIATHSQYSVGEDGKLSKTGDTPDLSQLEEKHTHAPSLSVHEGIKLSAPKEGHEKISYHIAQAKKYLDNNTVQFAKKIPTGELHPKFHEFIKHYSNNIARTTGVRSVSTLKKHADMLRDKELLKARKDSEKQGKKFDPNSKKVQNIHAKHQAFHTIINDNEKHFNRLFQAHGHITQAKHTILDHFRNHEHQFDVKTHDNEEHEGLVSVLRGSMAKLVREGPGGFPEKNVANAAVRFGTGGEPPES
jgi:hypothetical protein